MLQEISELFLSLLIRCQSDYLCVHLTSVIEELDVFVFLVSFTICGIICSIGSISVIWRVYIIYIHCWSPYWFQVLEERDEPLFIDFALPQRPFIRAHAHPLGRVLLLEG